MKWTNKIAKLEQAQQCENCIISLECGLQFYALAISTRESPRNNCETVVVVNDAMNVNVI